MKRILSLIFCCVFITLLIPQSIISAENESEIDVNCVEYDVIKQLGLLPNEVVKKAENGENVTRAEFAAVLFNLLDFKNKGVIAGVSDRMTAEDFFDSFYIEEESVDEASDSQAVGIFEDITDDTLFYNEIKYVTSNGYLMSNNNSFKPDNAVSYVDCLEEVLKLLGAGGYVNALGGYPEGVMKYGASKKLYAKSAAARMSAIDVCKLLYTALDENVIEGRIESGRYSYLESDILFMEKVLGLTEYTGILTNDGFKSLTGEETQINNITIGDDSFNCDFNCEKYFGMNVKAYVSAEEQTEYTVFAIEASKKNIVTEINVKDFSDYNSYRIYYNNGNREKNVKLSERTILIYNGKPKESWNKDDFDFADGSIMVIDNGSDYDVVVVENYKSVFVAGYDSDNKIIYNNARDDIDGNGDEEFNLESAYEKEKLIITKKDGTEASIGNIEQGMVIDIILNDDYAKLVLNNEVKKNVVVTSINKGNDDYNHYFTVSSGNENIYVLNSILSCADACDIVIGSSYTFYLNRNGDVAWVTNELKNDSNIGYCMRVYTDDNEKVFVKLITESGIILKFPVKDKINFVDENGNKTKIQSEAVSVRMDGYNGLISYKMGSDNELKYIELAQKQRNNDEKLKLIYDSDGTKISYQTHYSTGLTTFQNKFYLTDNTKVFVVPDDEESKKIDSNYKIGTKSEFAANSSYDVTGYNFKANSRIAQYVVCRKKVETKFDYRDSSLGNFVLVEDIYSGLNIDDEPCRIVKGKMFGYGSSVKEVEYYATIDNKDSRGNTVSEFETATDMVKSVDESGSYNTYIINMGDIIRVITEQDDKTVIMAQLVYSPTMTNPEFPDGRKGRLAGTRSNLLNGNDNYTNPFSMNYNNDTLEKCGRWTGGCKLLCGFVYNIDSEVMEITTKDLSVDSNYVRLSDEYITEWRRVNPSYTFTITKSGKNYTVTKGSSSDVKSFKDAGASCSKVIMCSINMNERATIIIND